MVLIVILGGDFLITKNRGKFNMDYVIINNQRFNLKKNLQDFVKYTMQKLLETNTIS